MDKDERMERFKETGKFELEYPIQHGSETIRELEFKRLKAKHQRGIDLTNMKSDFIEKLICQSTGQPPSVIGEMDAEDFMAAQEVEMSFLGLSLPTGK